MTLDISAFVIDDMKEKIYLFDYLNVFSWRKNEKKKLVDSNEHEKNEKKTELSSFILEIF